MQLITDWDELTSNIRTLSNGVASSGAKEREDHRAMVRQGTCFVVANIDGATVFAPSRFVGYVGNTLALHIVGDRGDGRRTNRAIRAITGLQWKPNPDLEALYIKYCYSLGLVPRKSGAFGAPRKFIDIRDRFTS
ncbi:MAG: hypothetical protein ACYDBB_02395 [Armatimonadota bacterium]